MADQIIVAWSRREDLVNDEHLLDGYFDVKSVDPEILPTRQEFKGKTYAKLMGRFAELARDNKEAALIVLRLDQTPKPVAMALDEAASELLRTDPVLYIKATNPPPRRVKIKIEDDVGIPKVKENLNTDPTPSVEPWMAPIRGGHDTLVESFGDSIYCRVSGNLIECPSCGRWASTKDAGDGEAEMECASCLFHDVFTITHTPEQSWAIIPTEALIQNGGNRHRFFIPRAWNQGGPWIKTEQLRQKYETFCKERTDASECSETSGSDAASRTEGG